jgi:hypothetical protein
MKIIEKLLKKMGSQFEEGGKFAVFHPVFQALDNFFLLADLKTATAPYGRDPIDVKRYMSMVIIALIPPFLASLYFFGWRVILLILVSYVAGGAVEALFAVLRKEEINEGFLVTGFIFPLILPPGIPLWLVAAGIIFGGVPCFDDRKLDGARTWPLGQSAGTGFHSASAGRHNGNSSGGRQGRRSRFHSGPVFGKNSRECGRNLCPCDIAGRNISHAYWDL